MRIKVCSFVQERSPIIGKKKGAKNFFPDFFFILAGLAEPRCFRNLSGFSASSAKLRFHGCLLSILATKYPSRFLRPCESGPNKTLARESRE